MRPTTEHVDDSCFSTSGGRGEHHAFLLPGLVPDGRETFLRQQSLFRAFGEVTTVTWPYDSFDLDRVIERIAARIRAAAAAGQRPLLVGVSVGGGIALELLQRTRSQPLPLAGIILVSPLTCADDLAPLLQRYLDPILHPPAGTSQTEALEKGRAFFRTLAQEARDRLDRAEEDRSRVIKDSVGLIARASERAALAADILVTNGPSGAVGMAYAYDFQVIFRIDVLEDHVEAERTLVDRLEALSGGVISMRHRDTTGHDSSILPLLLVWFF